MQRTTFALAALGFAIALPAFAQTAEVWHAAPINGGCTITILHGDPAPNTMTWSGTCTPGQPINGHGTLRVQATQDNQTETFTLESTFVSGVPNGDTTMAVLGPNGQQTDQQTKRYNMGCEIEADGGTGECTPYASGH